MNINLPILSQIGSTSQGIRSPQPSNDVMFDFQTKSARDGTSVHMGYEPKSTTHRKGNASFIQLLKQNSSKSKSPPRAQPPESEVQKKIKGLVEQCKSHQAGKNLPKISFQ